MKTTIIVMPALAPQPVFGIVKQAMGFRLFLLRGLEKVDLE